MFSKILRLLGSLVWRLVITMIVTVAIAVSLATVLVPLLPIVNTSLVHEIEARTGFDAEIRGLSAEMGGFRPKLTLVGLDIRNETTRTSVFRASHLEVTLNPWRSLLQRQLIFSEMIASDVAIPARLSNKADSIVVPIDPSVFATEIERVVLENTNVSLVRALSGSDEVLDLAVDLELRRDGSRRQLRLYATGSGGLSVSMAGAGIGNPFEVSRFSGEVNGRITAEDIEPLARFFRADVAGSLEFLFWTNAADGRAETTFQVEGEASLPSSDARYDAVEFSLAGMATANGTESWLTLAHADLALNSGPVEFRDIHFGWTEGQWQVVTQSLDVASSTRTLLDSGFIPEQFINPTRSASPRGTISTLSIKGSLTDGSLPRVAMDFENLVLAEQSQLPGVKGLSGAIIFDGEQGQLQVNSVDLELAIPTQFPEPLQLGHVKGIIDFDLDGQQVTLRNGRVATDAGDFSAIGIITGTIPFSSSPLPSSPMPSGPLQPEATVAPQLNVVLGAKSAPISRALAFTPKTIDPDAYTWMQTSLGTGRARQVGFILRGGVRKQDFPLRSIQLSAFADLEAVTMLPGLPLARDLSGYISIDNGLVTFDVDSARVDDLGISGGLVQVGRDNDLTVLTAQASIVGSLPDAVAQVATIPYVPEPVSLALLNLSTDGDVQGFFDLSMPIKGAPKVPTISTKVDVEDGSASYAGISVGLDELNGEFTYEFPRGITSGELSASFRGQDIALNLDLDALNLGIESPGLSVATAVSLAPADVSALFNVPISEEIASGAAQFDIAFQAGQGAALRASSDLSGLAVLLPKPLRKVNEEATAFKVDLSLADTLSVDLQYAQSFAATFMRDRLQDWRASISVGEASMLGPVESLDPDVIQVTGDMQLLDLGEWWTTRAMLSSAGNDALPTITWQDFSVDSLRLAGNDLGAVSTSGRFQDGAIELTLDSDFVDMTADYSDIEGQLNLQIDALNLDSLPDFNADIDSVSSGLGSNSPWPTAAIGITSIIFKEQDLGSLSFAADITETDIALSDFSGVLDGVTMGPASHFLWSRGTASKTRATLDLSLANAAEVLTLLDAKSVVDFSSGTILGDLTWSGGPHQFDASKVMGDLTLELSSGSFLPVPSQATDPLRFIGIFNLAGLVQRSNVNQLFDPGLTFDRARGDFSLNLGQVQINEFAIRNGGGSLTLGGSYLMVDDTIDAELAVTLPLVDNIPWVAALAGGLPIAAGAYLASKLFEDQMTRLSSGVYSVTGSVGAPEVKFVRVFDANVSSERAAVLGQDQSSEDSSASERR